MKKILIICFICLSLCACKTTKLKLTDDKGNSFTITDQGVIGLNIQTLEQDGFKVEVIEENAKDTIEEG